MKKLDHKTLLGGITMKKRIAVGFSTITVDEDNKIVGRTARMFVSKEFSMPKLPIVNPVVLVLAYMTIATDIIKEKIVG